MRTRFSNEEAFAAWDALSDDERAVYRQIKDYCAELRSRGQRPNRSLARKHVQRAMDQVCRLMRIIDVLETSETPFRGPGGPTISVDVSEIAAEQKAAAERTEQRMQELVRRERAEATELSERTAQAVIDGLKATIRDQAEKLADDEQVIDSLCDDLETVRGVVSDITVRLDQLVPGEGNVRSKIDALAQANSDAEADAERWKTEAAEARRTAETASVAKVCADNARDEARAREIELHEENAVLKAKYDLISAANQKLDQRLSQRDSENEELAQTLHRSNARFDREIDRLREEHNRQLFDLHSKINELKQALERVSSLAPVR